MKVFTFPQKKLARIERNLEQLEIGHTAILRKIALLQKKLDKAKRALRERENTMFYVNSVIDDLKIKYGNSKGSRINEKIKATLFETSVVHHKIKRLGVKYKICNPFEL